jgi:uncharacterized protein (DUF779 family)/tRNA-binding EMAP/Myf-like protein
MGVVAGANVIVWRMPGAGPASGPARILALQQPTAGGVDVPATREDVGALQRATSAALEESGARSAAAGPTVVVWPENSLSWDLRPRVAEVARELDVAIVFHAVEVRGADHLKRVIMVDAEGRQVLVNAKLHIAPDEIGTGEYSAGSVRLAGRAVTAYVCYDMHYPDSVARIGEADLVLVPINDAAYGPLQQWLHAADLAIRAVQSGRGGRLLIDNGTHCPHRSARRCARLGVRARCGLVAGGGAGRGLSGVSVEWCFT